MASLNLLVGYGSDADSSEEEISCIANPSTNQIVNPDEQERKVKQNNFFDADDSSSSNGDELKAELPKIETPNMSLMNPFRSTEASSGQSVFANPFKEAEDAEKNVLEKHVKLAPKLDDIREINGRKICWNYRKGRCRFGAKCVFAHDCELLQKKPPPMDPTEYLISSPNFEARPPNDDDRSTGRNNKRPGLSTESITAPAGGKVLKMNHHQEHHQGPGGHFRSNNK